MLKIVLAETSQTTTDFSPTGVEGFPQSPQQLQEPPTPPQQTPMNLAQNFEEEEEEEKQEVPWKYD